jgi:flavin-dependent dehydrogenase
VRNFSGLNCGSWVARLSSGVSRACPLSFRSLRQGKNFSPALFVQIRTGADNLQLDNDSRVAVIGSGPAGSFFSYFLLVITQRLGIDVHIDLYDPRDFSAMGPVGCNMCGGIISESLVQMLATEGINLPSTVVQRGIDSYMLHTDVGSIRIDTPLHEKRIAAIHRGSGPRDIDVKEIRWFSFDRYLQELAVDKGARLIRDRVDGINWQEGRPQVKTRRGTLQDYDLLAVAVGVNSATLKTFQEVIPNYKPPGTTKTFICEYKLGRKTVQEYFDDSMHVFLLNLPRLEFAAIIPKGDYATVCLLGEEIDGPLVKSFLESPAVRKCFPPDVPPQLPPCHCSPRINTLAAVQPFGDRFVFIGDSGVTRLFKDGIGAAYRTAKAAAETAAFHGLSCKSFREHYWPTCRQIEVDNRLGKAIFAVTRQMQKQPHDLRAILRMVSREQRDRGRSPRMSMVLWDLFTGSAPYREIIMRALHPGFVRNFLWNVVAANLPPQWAKNS